MAVPMMGENEGDYEKLCRDLEQQELDSATGVCSAQVYGQMLALYLLQPDLANAKFLWKRIPSAVKTSNVELSQIWAVGQKLWSKEYTGLYESFNKDWSEPIRPLMDALKESTRSHSFDLLSTAYSSIKASELSVFVGLPLIEAVQAAKSRGWQYDQNLNLLTPVPQVREKMSGISSEQHLSRLTDFVSFLEN